ncbi:hypothetical protein E2C01_083918 [Portunus trituberculatus]|uniref:Uncharacterized protein n=1 Tax=Portunus trituberculatus TaxID=210409 RepID=A0A5B7IWG0_PORTR|nr:hypothetical protein [Portunus trituberculatus]
MGGTILSFLSFPLFPFLLPPWSPFSAQRKEASPGPHNIPRQRPHIPTQTRPPLPSPPKPPPPPPPLSASPQTTTATKNGAINVILSNVSKQINK